MSRIAAYQGAAARCGTTLLRATAGIPARRGGAITKHPLDRSVAIQLIVALAQLGAKVRAFASQEPGDDRQFVFLFGSSFESAEGTL